MMSSQTSPLICSTILLRSFSQCLFNNFSLHRWERQRIIELVEKLEQLNPERSSIAML